MIYLNKKHPENADTFTSVIFDLEVGFKSRSKRLMSLDIT